MKGKEQILFAFFYDRNPLAHNTIQLIRIILNNIWINKNALYFCTINN